MGTCRGSRLGYGGLPSSESGRAAKYEALDRTFARRSLKVEGRSLTTMIPREDGPKASVSVSKDTVPAWLSIYYYFSRERNSPSTSSCRLTVTASAT